MHAAEGKQPHISGAGQERGLPINGAAFRLVAEITAIGCCGVKSHESEQVSERDDSQEGASERKRL